MLKLLMAALRKLSGTIVSRAKAITSRKDVRLDLVSERVLVVNTQRDSRVCRFCASMEGRRVTMPLLASKNFMVEYGRLEKATGWGRNNLLPPYHPNCRCDIEVREKSS